MLHSEFDFPESEGDSRKSKKVQDLVQHFSRQCRHYVPKQIINIDQSLINFEEKREEEKLCKLNKLVYMISIVLISIVSMISIYISYAI